ncbi:BQ5605_C006g03806 [Microbotryum silenes-dioicae]|uniref:BQ5605_C006g03806 protein n=1 Tax=Microbotryum silenes-dioicae TaxID=796604 RepID=A0A2X0M536_9BASI|nr:BQ5605_C006g03806 [Microbotryum silenes-dioicae]
MRPRRSGESSTSRPQSQPNGDNRVKNVLDAHSRFLANSQANLMQACDATWARTQAAKDNLAHQRALDQLQMERSKFYFKEVLSWPAEVQAQYRLVTNVDRFLCGEESYAIGSAS